MDETIGERPMDGARNPTFNDDELRLIVKSLSIT
jgi:hypothetical protein